MKAKTKKIPQFKTEDEERDFWGTHSPLDYFDLSTARRVSFPNLKPTTKSISIRLPEALIDELKILAHKKDVPYQSLAKMYLAREVAMERQAVRLAGTHLAVAEESVKYGSKKK